MVCADRLGAKMLQMPVGILENSFHSSQTLVTQLGDRLAREGSPLLISSAGELRCVRRSSGELGKNSKKSKTFGHRGYRWIRLL
jgi:hypothetical protein